MYARGLIVSYTKGKRRKSLEAQMKLEGELSNLEKTYAKYPSEANMKAWDGYLVFSKFSAYP